MKWTRFFALALAAALTLPTAGAVPNDATVTHIALEGDQVRVDGAAASTDPQAAVYVGADIVYYHDGTDQTYGEGEDSEKHDPAEAAAHTVVTITQPGTYRLSGTLDKGQIAIDLGDTAKDDPDAVVTLVLDNANVTCTVAPALIFYNVYECDRGFVGQAQGYQPSWDVDATAAGANVILAAGSENTFTGSHVARIYKPGTTENLCRYDGAFYSRMSMNIFGDNGDDTGVLNIIADNEGLDTELHLTLNGGTVNITAQDDGINTNEDNVSVTTVNGGFLTVNAGNGAEGDGIDSNGWLVINGGTVTAMSNDRSPDGGVDADRGILLNGGTLSAFGVRNDAIDDASAQPYLELSFAQALPAGSAVKLTDGDGQVLWSAATQKSCQSVTISTPDLALDTPYQLYVDDVAQGWSSSGSRPGGMGGQPPQGFDPGQMGQRPEDMPEPPEGFDPGQMGQRPQRPEGMEPPQDGFGPGREHRNSGNQNAAPSNADFTLTQTVKSFSGVAALSETAQILPAISQLLLQGVLLALNLLPG